MTITKVSNSVLNLSGNTDALGLPKGTDAQRPTPVAGMLRFNTETGGFEGYDGTEWGAIGGGGGFYQPHTRGGNGGSGVVILRLLTSQYSGTTTGSPTVTTDGSDTILTHTSSGTYTA